MNENMKRFLTLVMAVAMLVTMMPFGAVAQEETVPEQEQTDAVLDALEDTAPQSVTTETPTVYETDFSPAVSGTMLVDKTTNATITESDEAVWLRFTPTTAGLYTFQSEAGEDTDPKARLYDAEGNELRYDDDSGDAMNFSLAVTLEAGKTYYLQVDLWGAGNATIPVRVTGMQISALTYGITTNAVIRESGETAWLSFTPDSDGTYIISSSAEPGMDPKATLCGPHGEDIQHDDDGGADNNFVIIYQLEAGKTYYLKVSFCSEENTGVVPVTVRAFEVTGITMQNVTVEDRVDGSWVYHGDNPEPSFFEYDWLQNATYTVTFKDGSSHEFTGWHFSYNGVSYQLNPLEAQSENPWTLGNTYEARVGVGDGITATTQVTVVPCRVASVSFSPITMVEGLDGYTTSDGPGEPEYTEYDWWNNLEYTVTFNDTDRTQLTDYGLGFEFGGKTYALIVENDQSADNAWTAGNTYFASVQLGPNRYRIPVTIQQSPISSIVFDPVTVVENMGGDWCEDWNPETQSYTSYYRYYWWNDLTYTVFFRDGTTASGRGTDFYHEATGHWYYFSWDDVQSAANPWTKDNTYTVDMRMMGCTGTVSITVEGNPIQSVTARPVTLKAGEGCWISHQYNPDTGKNDRYVVGYNWQDHITYDVTMSDGSVVSGSGNWFYYGGNEYYVSYSDRQHEEPWQPGGTYQGSISLGSATAPVAVTILPSPFAEVTLEPISIVESTNGEWVWDYNPVTNTEEYFYRYSWDNWLEWTVSLADGSTITGSGTGLRYQDDDYYYFTCLDQQVQEKWTLGNTYNVTVVIAGTLYRTTVSVVESPVESITVHPLTLEENKNGYYSWGSYGEYFRYYWYQQLTFTVNFKDGTSLQGGYGWENAVHYDGVEYSIDDWDDNQYVQHWYAGNTYEATVTIAGKEYPVYVTVSSSTEDNGYRYLVQNGNAIITDCTLENTLLRIPETIDGYTVVGVTGLGDALLYAEEIRFPDTVTMLGSDVLDWDGYYYAKLPLKKLYLGSGITEISPDSVRNLTGLEWVDVSAENEALCSIDGVVYDKDVEKLVLFPKSHKTLHIMPDSVKDIESLFYNTMENYIGNPNIQLGAGVYNYVQVDGVIYTRDMIGLVMTTASATGKIVIPDSVKYIGGYSFANSNVTSVVIPEGVTELCYGAFWDSALLQEITIPSTVNYMEPGVFADCPMLEKIHITDLKAWCDIFFCDICLTGDANLYMNGEKIVDLVIPQGVTSISSGAFQGMDFESVTIPSSVHSIGYDAFYGCDQLKAVYIDDLAAWTGTDFYSPEANPLYYAKNLYLKGKLVKDLVIPETAANRAYPHYYGTGVGRYAFIHASIESVTVPTCVDTMLYRAFDGCEELKQVNISDVGAWSRIAFDGSEANPLSLAGNLFLNGKKLTEVVIPETVSGMIYDWAFTGANITKVTLPSTVTQIGYETFAYSGVQQVTFSEGLEYIHAGAFYSSALKSLDLPDSLWSISGEAFAENMALETVTFGNGLENIEWGAFCNTGIRELTLPDSLQGLGSRAFAGTSNLEKLDLGSGVTYLPTECFHASGLKKLVLPAQVSEVSWYAFADSALEEVVFDCDEVYLWDYAFANCPLGDLELGENVKDISELVFSGGMATQIRIPSSVSYLSYRAFAFQPNLVSVTLPNSIDYISKDVFTGCNNLSHVLFVGTQSQWNDIYCESPEINNATVHTGAGGSEVTTEQSCTHVTLYCSICDAQQTIKKPNANHSFGEDGICTVCRHDSVWDYEILDGAVTVTGYSGDAVEVEIPDTIEGLPVTAFTKEVFAYNQRLVSVVIPDTVTVIAQDAFRNCTRLTAVQMGDVTEIGSYAFYECVALTDLQLPDTLTAVGEYAFATCKEWRVEELPAGLTDIGTAAFYGCSYLHADTIPDGVTEIAYMAFANSGVMGVTLPASVTKIAYQAFYNCDNLTEVVIPKNVTYVGNKAFYDCYDLEILRFFGEKPNMDGMITDEDVKVFYPTTESWEGTEGRNWFACRQPAVTRAPQAVTGWLGDEITVSLEADGQRLRYQWYMERPGDFGFASVGTNSPELSVLMTEKLSGCRVYCLVTDFVGQVVRTDPVTLTAEEKPVLQLTSLPAKLTYKRGEELDPTGLSVTITYPGGTATPITGYQITGYNANASGKQTVLVSYMGLSAAFTVTVKDPYGGWCGENVSWWLEEGVLYIAGTGAMDDFTKNTQPWKDNRSEITAVVIHEGVTSIGKYAFYYCRNLEGMELPYSLQSVGQNAFYRCDALEGVGYAALRTQWEQIAIDSTNTVLLDAEVFFAKIADLSVKAPAKTEYLAGEELDLTGMTVTVRLSSGVELAVTEGYTVEGFHPNNSGEQEIIITYEGMSDSFYVTVILGGSCGENLTWKKQDGTLTISGTGEMYDYTTTTQPWKSLRDDFFCVIVEEGVTSIGKNAFNYCKWVMEVYLPESLQSVDKSAFYKTKMGESGVVFYAGSATAWEQVSIASGNELLTGAKFNFGKESVVSLQVTAPTKTEYFFGEALELEGLLVQAVYDSGNTETVTTGYTVTGYEAEKSGEQVITVTYEGVSATFTVTVLDEDVQIITGTCGENLAWQLVNGTLTISGEGEMNDYSSVENTPWYSYSGTITKVIIKDGVTSVSRNAFSELEKLTAVSVAGSVDTIGYSAFSDCPKLKTVSLGEGIRVIDRWAFQSCDSLESIILPASVQELGEGVFRYNNSMTGIWVEADSEHFASDESGVLFNKDMTTLIAAPCAISGSYYAPEGVTTIEKDAFNSCDKLTEVVLPQGVKTICDSAFEYCHNLQSVTLSEGLESIGYHAFEQCYHLKTIRIPASVSSIAETGVFTGCHNLEGIWVDENNASYCSDASGVLFNKDQTKLVAAPAFLSGTYVIPETVTQICQQAFGSSHELEHLVIPESVTVLPMGVFCGERLATITLPETLEQIDWLAFYYCPSLKDIYYGGTEEQWAQIEIDGSNEEYLSKATIHFKELLLGDVNGDGEVNTLDRTILTRYLANWEGYEEIDLAAADVNGDGSVDTRDRAILTRHLADWEGYEELPCTN